MREKELALLYVAVLKILPGEKKIKNRMMTECIALHLSELSITGDTTYIPG